MCFANKNINHSLKIVKLRERSTCYPDSGAVQDSRESFMAVELRWHRKRDGPNSERASTSRSTHSRL